MKNRYLFLITQIVMISVSLIGIINTQTHLLLELQNTFTFIIQIIMGLMYLGSIIYLTNLFLSIEQKKKNGLITFALIFVIPIGIWNIQPRLNDLIEKE